MSKKSGKINAITCMVTSLMLAIFISVIAILMSVKLGFASNNSLLNALDDVKYYDMVYKSFMDKAESILIPDGLTSEVLQGVFSEEQLRSDGNHYFKAQLTSTESSINIEGYKTKLAANINDYVARNNLGVDGDQNTVIEHISNDIITCYEEMIKIPYASTIGMVFRNINKYFLMLLVPITIFAIVCILLLYKQNKVKKNRIFRYLAYSIMSGAISIVIPVIYSRSTGFYKKLQIHPEYVYKFIIRYFENGLNIMTVIGVVLFVLALVMIALSTYIKSMYIKAGARHRHHHSHHGDSV